MSNIKKMAAGFYITLLTVLATVVSAIFYLVNCNTQYFANLGINGGIVVLLAVAAVLEIAYIIGSGRADLKKYFDLIPIISGMILMIAFVLLLNVRVSSIATILSFQKNAQTMADLSSAIAAMAACIIAAILNMAGAFFKVSK